MYVRSTLIPRKCETCYCDVNEKQQKLLPRFFAGGGAPKGGAIEKKIPVKK